MPAGAEPNSERRQPAASRVTASVLPSPLPTPSSSNPTGCRWCRRPCRRRRGPAALSTVSTPPSVCVGGLSGRLRAARHADSVITVARYRRRSGPDTPCSPRPPRKWHRPPYEPLPAAAIDSSLASARHRLRDCAVPVAPGGESLACHCGARAGRPGCPPGATQ